MENKLTLKTQFGNALTVEKADDFSDEVDDCKNVKNQCYENVEMKYGIMIVTLKKIWDLHQQKLIRAQKSTEVKKIQ